MWTPIDTQFFGPKTPIAIACVYNHSTASVFRYLLEELGAVTLFHSVGTPGDFLKVIAQDDSAPPYLVIASHGEEGGLHFGDFMEGIDISMLTAGCLPPRAISEHVKLAGCVIVNIACDGGSEEMADAFLSGGARAYIGTNPNPNAAEHPIFVGHFFHSIIRRNKTPFEAWEMAAAYDHRSCYYHFFDKEGKHTYRKTNKPGG